MQNSPLISVCVPTHKRLEALEQLIGSFMLQSYRQAELVIVDDSPSDQTKRMVNSYMKNDRRIRYFINKKNLGYAKNLLRTFKLSRGKYLFLLGDDDLLLEDNILEKYVKIFKSHPKVAYIYSNIIQFNNSLELSYAYKFYLKDKEFSAGKEALQNIWLNSTFIAGIGIKKIKNFNSLYPDTSLLFPQVKLIAELLFSHNAYGLAKYAVGARSHSDQLGFHMMENKRVSGVEKHAYNELYIIADELKEGLQQKNHKNGNALSKIVYKTIKDFLERADMSTIIAEGTKTRKSVYLKMIFRILKNDKRVKHSALFWMQLGVYIILPKTFIIILKELYRKILIQKNWKNEKNFFNQKRQVIVSKLQK